MFDLKNRIAIVTGGGSGIGLAIASVFAARNAKVFIFDQNETAAHQVSDSLVAQGFSVSAVACDVSDQAQVEKEVTQIIDAEKRIDILINSAGIAHIGNIESTTEEDMQRLFDVNVKGTYNMMRAVVRQMKNQRGGVILNLCSVAASVGIAHRFAYSMTKGAVRSMTFSVAKDYVDANIRCNCISPGRVHTAFVDGFLKANYPGQEREMFEKLSRTQPIGRMGTPEEIAALALYLCSDESAFVTGSDYNIDGGFIALNS